MKLPKLPDDYDDYDDDDGDECLDCGGEGCVYGSDLDDPLWYGADELYVCRNCHGSGLRKDMVST